MMKKILSAVLASLMFVGVFATLGTLAGCNTVEGVGRDLQQGGRAIRDEANEQRRN